MPRALSAQQEASAVYIIGQLTPLAPEAMDARIAEIHLEPGRDPGPDCGCNECLTQHGPLGAEIPNATPPSEISHIPPTELT